MAETVIVKITGLKEVNKFLLGLPKNMEEEIERAGETFMKNVQKSAKLRAPRWTGKLAQSIMFRKMNKSMILEVTSPYGIFQEFGFSPHFIGRNLPTRSGFRVGDWMRDKGVQGMGITVRKNKPFLIPALEMNIAKLDILLNNHASKAIRRS